jgi:DNA-binding response OmpR family regulator
MSKKTILIIDDDPIHLQIYRLILESAGFVGLPALVTTRGVDFPESAEVDAVLLDYRLAPNLSARDVAQVVRERYPAASIVILSDMYDAPVDTAPFVDGFVRKGNPAQLLSMLRELVQKTV